MRTTTPSSLSKPPPEPVHQQGRTPLRCPLLTQSGHWLARQPDHFQPPSLARYDATPGLGGAMRRREFITLLGAAAPWTHWPTSKRHRRRQRPPRVDRK